MSIKINGDENIKDIAEKTANAVKYAVLLTSQDVQGNVIENSPVDHGRLSGSWQLKRVSALRYMVSTAVQYAKWVNDGTGIYGSGKKIQSKKPGRKIYPRGKALKFEINGRTVFAKFVQQPRKPLSFSVGGSKVFAMSSKGMKGRKYVEKSIAQTEARKAQFVDMALAKEGLL